MENLSSAFYAVLEVFAASSMMFGGVFPFVPQYKEIKRLENADGFSLHVCFVLLLANSLRILFWFGHPFELPLLIQSIVMIFAMFTLIELCVKTKNKSAIIRGRERQFFDFDSEYFWAWTDLLSYIEFMATFTASVGLAIFLFIDVSWFVELIGFLAVFSEAMLAMPQFYKNFRNSSTEGMNKSMVIMWMIGDIYKTQYFILRSAPVQFTICGSIQIMLDIAILFQIWFYSSRAPIIKAKVDR